MRVSSSAERSSEPAELPRAAALSGRLRSGDTGARDAYQSTGRPRPRLAAPVPAPAPADRADTGPAGYELDRAVARRLDRAAAGTGPLELDDATRVFTFVLSRGRRETAEWKDMNTLLTGLPPPSVRASELLSGQAPPSARPKDKKAPELPVPKGRIEGRHPITDDQLLALVDAYGRLRLTPPAQRRLEAIFSRVSLTGNAEEDKQRYAKRLLAHEERRLDGQPLDGDAVRKLSCIFRMGGLTAQSRAHLDALLHGHPLSPSARARLGAADHEPVAEAPAEWTYFVHLEGRSSLAQDVIPDVQEMEKVGSLPGRMNVVALITSEGRTGGDPEEWRAGTRLLHIRRDEDDPQRIVSSEEAIDPRSHLGRLLDASRDGALKPSDPEVLRAAVEYVKKEFPSRHLAVDLWGHGSRAEGAAEQEGAIISPRDLGPALKGLDVEFLAFDSCNMGTYEAASAAESAGVRRFVASQYEVPGEGFAYDRLLGRAQELMRQGQEVSAETLGKTLVDQYAGGDKPVHRSRYKALSSVDLQQLPRVREKLDRVATLMIEKGGLTEGSEVLPIYRSAMHPSWKDVDLGDLARRLSERYGDAPLGRAAAELSRELARACYVRHSERAVDEDDAPVRSARPYREPYEKPRDGTGLSIFAPAHFDAGYQSDTTPFGHGPWVQLLKTLPAL